MKTIYLLLACVCPLIGITQNIGIGTQTPHNSAMLEVSSNSKGLLTPRLTTVQRKAITSPAPGLLVYDTNTSGFWYYDGSAWISLPTSTTKVKSIYVPGNGLSYSPSASIAPTLYGLNLSNTASQVAFVIPKPVDWDSTKPFTITIHFSLPTNSTNTFIQWRLTAGGMKSNLQASSAVSGWDSYNYYTNEDAPLLVAYAAGSYSNLSKSQSWTTKFSSTYNTWYFGATNSVTVANSFSDNPVWRFGFQRGTAAGNGETYSGNITINGVTIQYEVE